METIEKTEIQLPADLAKRYTEAKNDKERNAVLAEYATRLGGEDAAKKEAAFMSDDQFRSFLEKVGAASAEQAKAAIAAVAGDVERKYNLDGEDAKKIAEKSFMS